MKIFDRYVFRNITIATIFVAVILAVMVLLTQSLKFLELVINADAGGLSFWVLTLLALPRFFEIILPLSLMAALLFVYNRMTVDSEMVVIRASGYSPMALARPALTLAAFVTLFLLIMTMWAAPKALSGMNEMRQIIKAQVSSFLFREGVFNQAGSGVTVYMRKRDVSGELQGLMIHDSRDKDKAPATILAKRGVVVANENGHQVLVYDGSRQEYDPEKGVLHRLNFERYTVDLPASNPVRVRWTEPDERTIFELLRPDPAVQRDVENLRDFRLEIHRRIVSTLLAPLFALISCVALLLGPLERRGQSRRILSAVAAGAVLQSLFIVSFNLARQHDWGLAVMYVVVLVPLLGSLFMLSTYGESLRRSLLYNNKKAVSA